MIEGATAVRDAPVSNNAVVVNGVGTGRPAFVIDDSSTSVRVTVDTLTAPSLPLVQPAAPM